MTRSTRLKMVVGFALAASLLGAIAVLAQLSTTRLVAGGRAVAHTLEVLATLEETLGLLLDAETDQRGYLLSGDEVFQTAFGSSAALVVDRANVLGKMVAEYLRSKHVDIPTKFLSRGKL